MKLRFHQCLFWLVLSCAVLDVTSLEDVLTQSNFDNFLEPLKDLFALKDATGPQVKFSLRKPDQPDDDVCYIVPGKPESLADCTFNSTSKTFLVIHGWTVSGLFESWVAKLVAALYERERGANVIVVDWLSTAQNHYVIAAQNTKSVGQDIAHFIDWIEETTNIPLENLHLIGYSLGAHVAGFAGSHTSNKVGRITGLDPAGPDFEGVHAHRRLSPDDAHFVDVLHTFSRSSLGLSIGIEQPVGHIDIYPNGGAFQPGCNLRGALEKIANFGIFAMNEATKCEHERSIHLFIDSLLNEQEASMAYSCGSNDIFDRGMCLRCHKNRCNTIGYDVSKVRKARSIKMFTKTRASMPFKVTEVQEVQATMENYLKGSRNSTNEVWSYFDLNGVKIAIYLHVSVYHYQLKIHFSSKANQSEMDPSLTVSLHGTKGDAENLPLNVKEKIAANKTHSFLLVTEKDIGDLLMLKFRWEDSTSWSPSSALQMVSSWWSGDSSSIDVHKVRIRVGETQKKIVLCVKDPKAVNMAQEVTFVKCKNDWRGRSQRKNLQSH